MQSAQEPEQPGAGSAQHPLTPVEIRIVGLVPLLEPYFRGAAVSALMPEPLREAMDSHGLTPRHGAVLPQLLAADGPLTVSGIADRLQVSLPTASELVGGLARAGIVTRAPDETNRRRVLVSLAEEYRPLLDSFVARRGEPLLRALAGLPAEQREGFMAGLRAWVREVQQ
ncbi:MarR family winged helix-turn-helix transcriptional regulator [Streptomyces alboflavus]|uniref:MarR family winged helix-turn-helix transcriptional regulator n=1 Tax=Streptomyces alboflavus TaxID=67267 RepID=UPI001F017EAE|nr:MarR family transcriptional regulator [Streptomyces alboflavus]